MLGQEIGVMHLQAKGHRKPGESWDGFSLRASRRSQPCPHLDFGLIQKCKTVHFSCFKPPGL